jgi:hypothetical protein
MNRVTVWNVGDEVERFAENRSSDMPIGRGIVTAVDIGSADQPIEVDDRYWPYIEDIIRVLTPFTPTLEMMLTEWRDLEARAQAAQAEADALFEHAGQCHGEIVVRLAELGWGAPRMVPGEPVVTLDDSDGWIEWKGGECPVPKGTLIDVKYDDGYKRECKAGDNYAEDWSRTGHPRDIVAYRLTPSTQP